MFPALAALAWGEPRRRAYWETELINALRIVEKGWATPKEMVGSWAGAMGHTQWMPEVWLNVGMDYDGDGRVNPFGKPDDALGIERALSGQSRQIPARRALGLRGARAGARVGRDLAQLRRHGRSSASRAPTASRFRNPKLTAKLWVPVAGGPAFLLGPNFYAMKSYNPSMNYTLAIVHLGDRVLGGGPFVQPFPGSERAPTLAEVQEMQKRLTAAGFDTGGTDGRVGNMTMAGGAQFPAEGGAGAGGRLSGLKLLAKLRGG